MSHFGAAAYTRRPCYLWFEGHYQLPVTAGSYPQHSRETAPISEWVMGPGKKDLVASFFGLVMELGNPRFLGMGNLRRRPHLLRHLQWRKQYQSTSVKPFVHGRRTTRVPYHNHPTSPPPLPLWLSALQIAADQSLICINRDITLNIRKNSSKTRLLAHLHVISKSLSSLLLK